MVGHLEDYKHYAYADPFSRRTLFWHCRARVVGDPTRRKTFWYVTADPKHPGWWSLGAKEHPGAVSRPCLYMLGSLRCAVARHALVILWTEGEKDALAAREFGTATSHHGGAGKATEEQAEHFAPLATRAGRRAGTRVLVAVDRDDPGYACGWRRYSLLREVGLRREQLAVVRAADSVLSGGGGCGADAPCYCDVACPIPSEQWRGADLADHVAAGYGLRDLVTVPSPALRAAAAETAARQQQGWVYGVGMPPPLTPEEREWVRNSPWLRRRAIRRE